MLFEIGQTYNRRGDIHDRFGGQRQGGISTPSDERLIFLFTGESGQQYGYRDGWSEDGVFLYTGEGQKGDMAFVRGNRAIRDHVADGNDLLLFQSLGKGHGCRYVGQFDCASFEERRGSDVDGADRKVIVFHLISMEEDPAAGETVPDRPAFDIDELRRRALEAGSSNPAPASPKVARALYHQRSEAVRQYVLARADGTCEACGKPAPFQRRDGTPYLEPHHIRRLSDGGPDHPRWVGAICPNCHRQIHHGDNGDALNLELENLLGRLEL